MDLSMGSCGKSFVCCTAFMDSSDRGCKTLKM